MPNNFDLSVIIVSWNTRERLRECLRSLYGGMQGLTCEVFVVDNASTDGSAAMVASAFPRVRLIQNKENRGFAAANNQALREADGECVLLLNPDMRVFEDTLPIMVAWMRAHPAVGVAGCKLINEKGETHCEVRRFPDVWSQFFIVTKPAHLFSSLTAKYRGADFDLEKEQEVDQVRGSFFMIRRECLEGVGLLDEHFFLCFEEVDFCKRAKAAGWKVMYTPTAACVDYKGEAFRKAPQVWLQRQFTKSMCFYFKKHGRWWEWVVLQTVRPFGITLVWLHNLFVNSKRCGVKRQGSGTT